MPYYPPASGGTGASTANTYVTAQAESNLSAEVNLGALTSGILKHTVAGSVSTPATAVAGTDYLAPLTDTVRSTDADLAMAVNTIYHWDTSGLGADRTATLPGTFAVGDLCGIFITVGGGSREILITATSGDNIIGSRGSVAGGTEWSRLWITGELVIFRGSVANTTWEVYYDGRIPMKMLMTLTTLCDGESAATFTAPTAAATPGAWTLLEDTGNIATVATSLITARRACNMLISIGGQNKDNGTAGNYFDIRILHGAIQTLVFEGLIATTGTKAFVAGTKMLVMAEGDTAIYQFRSQAGGLGMPVASAVFMCAQEVL